MPIDDLTALGEALRAARKEKNLTQEQLDDEAHVSTKQIADIEKAKRNPSYVILKALAKVVHGCFRCCRSRLGEILDHAENTPVPALRGLAHLCRNVCDLLVHAIEHPR